MAFSVPRFSVNNHIAANLVMAILLFGGLFFAITLPRDLFPTIEVAIVRVSVAYPGSTPAEIEKGAVIKIEEAVFDLNDVKEIRSTIGEGFASIIVEFESGTDLDQAVNDIKAAVDQLRNMPDELEEISYRRIELIVPVISVVVFGDSTPRNLRALAEQTKDELLALDDISKVEIVGVVEPEISVDVDPAKLEQYGLTFREVARGISSGNLDIPGGELKASSGDIRVRTLGEREAAHALEDIVVRSTQDGKIIRVADVATVTDGFKDIVLRGRHNGSPAAMITVFKTAKQDSIKIAGTVVKFVDEKKAEFTGAIQIDTRDNTSTFIQQRLRLLVRNALWGGVFVFLSLALFLSFRIAFWAALGIPVSLLGTFIFMSIADISTNMITLFALIVILGMVVDDAIIIGENVFRRYQEGLSPRDAAIEGTNEVARPVVATIFTTIAAFLPLTMITGVVGEVFRPLAWVVIIALSVSLFEAFVVLPAHLEGALGRVQRSDARAKRRRSTKRGDPKTGALTRFWLAKERFIETTIKDKFGKLLELVIDWRYVSVTVALTLLFVTLTMAQNDRPPLVMMQELDSDMLAVNLTMDPSTQAEKTAATIEIIEEVCLNIPETKSILALVGAQFNMSMGGGGSDVDPERIGQVLIETIPAEERTRHSEDIMREIRAALQGLDGVESIKISGMNGTPGGPEFEVQVRGEDLGLINEAVQKVKAVYADFAGIEDIRSDLSTGKMEARIGLTPVGHIAGVTVQDLAMQLRGAVFGVEAQTLQRGRDEVEVQVRLRKDARDSLADLERIRIATPQGGRVPLSELAALEMGRGAARLTRVDRKRTVTVMGDLDTEGTQTSAREIATAMESRLSAIAEEMPGISFHVGGEKEELGKSFDSMLKGMMFACAVIYSILALVFRSYIQPLLIMAAIPFGVIGMIFGHLIMGFPVTVASWIGTVALTGIVVNDSLILIDFINRARERGLKTREAILQGGKMRLRPILLTSLTTILGLAPLMVERSLQAQVLIPMAISIAFGLAFATFLTLLIVPCFYYIMDDAVNLARGLWTNDRGTPQPK